MLRISVVTPNFNHGRYLEEAIRSVLGQGYPALEYVIVDGGSTDGSLEIIKRHEAHLAWWVSEPDAGHYDALNKGFARTTGEIMAWLNSDDLYPPWTFSVVGEIFQQLPEVEWLTGLYPLIWDARGRAVACRYVSGYNRKTFARGVNLRYKTRYFRAWIQQESTFWRRSLWEKAGARVDGSVRTGGDFELWTRFFQHSKLHGVAVPLGGFRRHGDQKTARMMAEYKRVANEAFLARGGRRYGLLEGPMRRICNRWLGGRSIIRALPRGATYLLWRLGILSPVRNIVWSESHWVVEKDFVV